MGNDYDFRFRRNQKGAEKRNIQIPSPAPVTPQPPDMDGAAEDA